jgi:pilus assembly protein CpaF
MNTGHEGSLSTAHANSPRDVLSRLETMALMSDVELPVSHVREQIAGALDVIVHMARLGDGTRAVSRVSAVEGLRAGSVLLQDIFVWRRGPQPGFQATGAMPSVTKLLAQRDERIDPRIFAQLAAGEGKETPGAPEPARVRREKLSTLPDMRPHRNSRGVARPGWPGRVRRLGTILD